MRSFCFYICFMVDITQVYEILRDLSNKDQRGFVTQNEFNNFASAAQTKISNEIFSEVLQAGKLRRQQVDGKGAMSLMRQKQEDLSYYFAEYDLLEVGEGLDDYLLTQQNEDGAEIEVNAATQDRYEKPRDLKYVIGIFLGETDAAGATAPPCEIIRDAQKYRRVLNSKLSHPTLSFPVAYIQDREIRISPAGGLRPVMTYYRQPRARYAAQQVVDAAGTVAAVGDLDVAGVPSIQVFENALGVQITDTLNTRNFDLPEHYLSEVVVEMAHMIGMNVRDTALMRYGLKLATEQ